jgi:large subunit ribosomal protein L21
MFAVIKTGGKQYRVAKDDVIAVEKLDADAGATVVFDTVLALGDKIGSPAIADAKVAGVVVKQFRDEKKIIFKKRRRKHYRRRTGHRQHLTLVKISEMGIGLAVTATPKAAAEKKAAKKKTAKAAGEATPARKAAAKKTAKKAEA